VTFSRPRTAPPALDSVTIERIALAYVSRYATSRAKLRDHLLRKIAARGWTEDETAETAVGRIIDRFVELGYVDDRALAEARGRSLRARGYGARRLGGVLGALGISEVDAENARRAAEEGAWEAAVRFARKRRLGPFAPEPADEAGRRRAFAAMMRAGHAPDLAKRILSTNPDDVSSWDS
jgi:regulatory protein